MQQQEDTTGQPLTLRRIKNSAHVWNKETSLVFLSTEPAEQYIVIGSYDQKQKVIVPALSEEQLKIVASKNFTLSDEMSQLYNPRQLQSTSTPVISEEEEDEEQEMQDDKEEMEQEEIPVESESEDPIETSSSPPPQVVINAIVEEPKKNIQDKEETTVNFTTCYVDKLKRKFSQIVQECEKDFRELEEKIKDRDMLVEKQRKEIEVLKDEKESSKKKIAQILALAAV